MALTIVRGFTFAGNETVTASKLHQLIEQALITGIDASNLAPGSEIITISGTEPSSPLIGTLWFDSGSALLRRWDGSTFKVIEVHVGDAQPTNTPLQEGQLWVDTTGATTFFKVFDGSSFITVLIGTVDLTTDVSGILPTANGGTNSSSTQFVDLTTNVTGVLPKVNGGSASLELSTVQELYVPASGTVVGVKNGFMGGFTAFTDISGAGSVGSDSGAVVERFFSMETFATIGSHHGFRGDNNFLLSDGIKEIIVGFYITASVSGMRLVIGLTNLANTGATLLGADDPAVANILLLHFASGASANFQFATKNGSAGAWIFTDSGVAAAVNTKYYLHMISDGNGHALTTFALLDKNFAPLGSTTITEANAPATTLTFVMGVETTDTASNQLKMTNAIIAQRTG